MYPYHLFFAPESHPSDDRASSYRVLHVGILNALQLKGQRENPPCLLGRHSTVGTVSMGLELQAPRSTLSPSLMRVGADCRCADI